MANKLLKRISVVAISLALCISSVAMAENFMKKTDRALYRQRPLGQGTGVRSSDLANATLGIFNVEAVFEGFHANEPVRDLDTRICAEIGVSELAKGSGSTGQYCCEVLWEVEGKTLHKHAGVNKKMDGFFGGRDKDKRDVLKLRRQFMEYCCPMSDDKKKGDEKIFCQTVAQEKAGCVKGELNKNGQDMKEALSACELECDVKQYEALKHNEDGKYDSKEVEGMVKTCTMDNVDWAPSTTVPGAEAFVPAVPKNIGEILTSGGENDK